MAAIDSSLVLQLWEIFPDSFSITSTGACFETYNGPFGTEEIQTGTTTETLASCILNTANAIHIKYGAERSTAYLKEFSKKTEQQKEILAFTKCNYRH